VGAGALTRKTMPAMAITLVGLLASRLLVELLARPRFLAPLRRTFPVIGDMAPNQLSGEWLLRAGVYSAEGTRLRGGVFGNFTQAVCGTQPTTVNRCLVEFGPGAYNLELFHPADRFWLFQGIETALFVALAVLLLLASVHWVRRRIS
jgi:hypothetical protein